MAAAKVRLMKELAAIKKSPTPLIRALPSEKDVLTWHYVIMGPPETPYEGGYYHGVIQFPSEYPLRAPGLRMHTPSGRFKPGEKICTTYSDFHPESWTPAWGVTQILIGLQSFMVDTDVTAGSIETDAATKRSLAKTSLEFNVKNNRDFCSLFPDLVALHNASAAGGGAGAAAAAAASSSGSASPAAAAAAAPAGAAAGAAPAGAAAGAAGAGNASPAAGKK
jgi:ubiquitin-conjugating enzyme E2 J2